jgi:hypothetical protein
MDTSIIPYAIIAVILHLLILMVAIELGTKKQKQLHEETNELLRELINKIDSSK